MVTQLLARKLVKAPKYGIPSLVRCWGNRGASFLLNCIGAWKNSTSKKHNALDARYEALADVRRLRTEDGMANELWHTISGTTLWREWVDPVDRLTFVLGNNFPTKVSFFSGSEQSTISARRDFFREEKKGKTYFLRTVSYHVLPFCIFPLMLCEFYARDESWVAASKNMLVQQTGQHSTVKLWNLQTWDYSCQFNPFHCKNWSILRVNKMNNLSTTCHQL